jgi:lysophospholipase L1-like esterase
MSINFRFVISRFLLVIGSVVFTLLMLEMLLRLFLPQTTIWEPTLAWEPADGLGWWHKPNLDMTLNTGEGDIRLLTDGQGYRIGATPMAGAEIKILATGDSFVEALQVNDEQTMTSLLAQSLTERMGVPVAVTAVGMGGYNPNHYLIQAQKELAKEEYDLLLVFITIGNDLVSERVTYFPPATNLYPPKLDFSQGWSSVQYAIALRTQAYLSQHSHLYVLVSNQLRYAQMRSGRVPVAWPSEITLAAANAPEWQVTGQILRDIANEAAAQQTAVLFILIPAPFQVDELELAAYMQTIGGDVAQVDVWQPARLMAAELSPAGLTVLDPLPALQKAHEESERPLFGRIDRHFTPYGHQVMADFLETAVLETLSLRDGP